MASEKEMSAERAAALLQDEGFKTLLRALKNETLVDWANTPSADAERREELYRDIQAIGRVENRLNKLVQDNEMDRRKAAAREARATK